MGAINKGERRQAGELQVCMGTAPVLWCDFYRYLSREGSW